MKSLDRILVVLVIMVFSGCQQSQQKQGSEISRKDRLIANENLELKNELARCRNEKEKQRKLLEQCQQEKEKIEQEAGNTEKWLIDKLPQSQLDETTRLTKENEELKARIEELEKAMKQPSQQEQRE